MEAVQRQKQRQEEDQPDKRLYKNIWSDENDKHNQKSTVQDPN